MSKEYVANLSTEDWWGIKVEFKGGTVVKADSHHDFHQAWVEAGRPAYIQRAASCGIPVRCHPVIKALNYHDALVMSGFFGTPVGPDQGVTFASPEAMRTAAKGLRRAGMPITPDKLGWLFRIKDTPAGIGHIVEPQAPKAPNPKAAYEAMVADLGTPW
jgi:hypothetical protein